MKLFQRYALLDEENKIKALFSTRPLSNDFKIIKLPLFHRYNLGDRLSKIKPSYQLRVAFISNFYDKCGISTYAEFLVEALSPYVSDLTVFSEENNTKKATNVVPCWKRGQPLTKLIKNLKEYKPDLVIINHEFGIFPKAGYFLQLNQSLYNVPTLTILHSVYEHEDKMISTSACKGIMVHTEGAKTVLENLGHSNKIFVIPHGCNKLDLRARLWNTFGVPYTIFQFGFLFPYKNVEVVLKAISVLKQNSKYKDVFFTYLASEGNFPNVHDSYYNKLIKLCDDLGINDNVAILRGFHSDKAIEKYLKICGVAVFSYQQNQDHKVYGASGACRIALSKRIPIITSNSPQFTDLEGIVPRISDENELANELDKIFSNPSYKDEIVARQDKYVKEANWKIIAEKILAIYPDLY